MSLKEDLRGAQANALPEIFREEQYSSKQFKDERLFVGGNVGQATDDNVEAVRVRGELLQASLKNECLVSMHRKRMIESNFIRRRC